MSKQTHADQIRLTMDSPGLLEMSFVAGEIRCPQ